MLQHTGGLYGYGALSTILPDMDIGVFLALNGADETLFGRGLTHIYIMDLLLGKEPWLNTTTGCTFPRPWYPRDVNDAVEEDRPPLRKVGFFSV